MFLAFIDRFLAIFPFVFYRAVIETVIQKERMEQVKFNNKLKQQAEENKKRNEEQILKNAKQWHELQTLKKKRRFEVNKQHQKEILDQ